MRSKHGRLGGRWLISCVALLGAASIGVGCGSDDSGSSGSVKDAEKAAAVTTAIPKSGCGAVPLPAPSDPDGVLASLPETYQKDYAGFRKPVRKSPWSDFKPDHGPPYKIGMAFSAVIPGFQTDMLREMKKELGNDPDIEFTAVATGDALNIPQQIQNFNAMLNDDPDLLIVEPLTDAFGSAVDKAAKKGIPTISFQGNTSSKNAVNVSTNDYNTGATLASTMFRQLGGKGNILYVHGLASIDFDIARTDVTKAAMKNCPGIKKIGDIGGGFVNSMAKGETLKFLATHPEKIDGVLQTGQMGPGVISAFEQAGRPVPVMDIGATRLRLGYWNHHRDSFVGIGNGFNVPDYGITIASIAKRMLAGRGVKVDQITKPMPTFTENTLDEWVEPGGTCGPRATHHGPDGNFMTEEFLSGLFNDPKPG